MAVQGSGEISLSDVATEFGDTQPHDMSEFYREGGKVPGVNSNVPTSGAIRMQNFYGSVNELLQTVTANASINAQTIFGSDWGSAVPKRLSIPAGVTIGPLTIPTGMGGTLEVDVEGEIQGTGGSAGSAGGNAITASTSFTLNVLSGGAVRGGGGGGGTGGTGGNGSYQSTSWSGNQYQPSQDAGPIYGIKQANWFWAGGLKAQAANSVNQKVGFDGRPYRRGGYAANYRSTPWYRIAQGTVSTVSTSGGSGGSGGVGRGYGQSLTSGSNGSAGGTNAGTGGTGGSGGDWATSGSTGSTGANGNASNGSSGSGGGAAGRAVQMNAGTVTVNNSGTINGAY